MAKDDARVQSYALLLFKSIGNFVEYVIKVCSPGPITDAELIIVHLGLYWLFYECSDISTDANTKRDYATQAFVCHPSLRLGRSSTIRDDDVTVPRPLPEQMIRSPWQHMLLDGIEMSNLYGRVFDRLYSPSARAQSATVRTSRARALSAELEGKMATRVASSVHGQEYPGHLTEPRLIQFLQHADKAPNYSVLASIYKSVSSPESSGSSSCPECVSASRTALQEHVACISLATDSEFQYVTVEFLVNAALLLSPFIPFSILFCNIVETSDSSDLQHLGRFVEALKSLSAVPRYARACGRQLPIFKALYEVAAKYVEAKGKAWQSGPSINGGLAGQAIEASLDNENVRRAHPVGSSRKSDGPVATSVEAETQQIVANNASRNNTNEMKPDFGMEVDLSSAEIGDWFYHSQQMMRLLADG
ncbi:hypothetical protein FALBO_15454 [Fusarium albosuccineum]|uniref:Transcription factor domain-containing protein n=1 Tax=Fusarium albosuccineum TaxID=1237068 RepID=A0A8H4KRQ3_9HYPO|nr:hypothetical protein FALBO_15454 [Fusarium albosuccineum]